MHILVSLASMSTHAEPSILMSSFPTSIWLAYSLLAQTQNQIKN